ncbi:hypothetical protein MANES_04G049450v8 [Manihot esculenta]|uniref:Uncharacterized protein n=1 Tax=Manihot esculenta TaxID=3983 RepID=A0ACB7HRX2_MANES|nr:hypothetical protein MANES_04G049450v8 [Manihot esculenta]
MEKFLVTQQKQDKAIRLLIAKVDQLATHNKMLENQIAQQASSSNKATGKLPSQLENPRKHYNAIILRTFFQMPSYAKFLKEILPKKRKLEEFETVALTKQCNPGSFSSPCDISDLHINGALCDLSTSVSMIPLSICQKLKLGELNPTGISLQLIDR